MQFKPPVIPIKQNILNTMFPSKQKQNIDEALCIPKGLLDNATHGYCTTKQYKFDEITQQIIVKDICYEDIYKKE